jgi:hypothetical protein
MKQTINFALFCDLFSKGDRYYQFSPAGKRALYDYLTELEDETGEEFELDIVGLCCDYAEYDNLAEFQENYGTDYTNIDAIADETTVICIPDTDSFIIGVF